MDQSVMKSPRSLDIEITNSCNLRCTYCSHFSSSGDVGEDLPLEAWLRFFGELGRCAVMTVTLSGGEPFLRPDLRDVIRGIVAHRMRFSILSNGTLVDPDMAAFLAATGRCDLVQVSIDGSVGITHDAFRGEGTFMKAIRGVRILQEHQVPVSVRVTIHRKNVYDLDAIARLLLEDLGLPSFSTNSACHMGLCRKNAALTQLTVAERTLAMETLLALNEKYGGRISATSGPLAEGQVWKEMEEARREKRDPIPGRGYLTGCNGPSKNIAVRADGVMVPCLQLGHLSLGRINEDDLLVVWQTHPELEKLRGRFREPLDQFPFCQGCPYIGYCTGNCPAIAYTLTGSVQHPAPDACLRLYLGQGGRLPGDCGGSAPAERIS
jgi:SynChlorMet cassette radical SAM/SPASM protein ScmE